MSDGTDNCATLQGMSLFTEFTTDEAQTLLDLVEPLEAKAGK